MKRREFIVGSAMLGADFAMHATTKSLRVEIWHGRHHRIGHLGDGQDDFNVLGHVYCTNSISSVNCSVNRSAPRPLRFSVSTRIVRYGDFNADIPVASLRGGDYHILIEATDSAGNVATANVIVTRQLNGAYPLPAKISWGAVRSLEDVGLCTDGRWVYGPQGLRTAEIGYDRVFLIGNKTWKDYEVTAPVTIHGFSPKNGPQSGTVHHAGFCLRWAGHSTEDNEPGDQPKWGLHPRGGIVWLTSLEGGLPPVRQFWPGDSERFQTFAPFPIRFGRPFWMKGRCETLEGHGVTLYSFKVWNDREPEKWDFQVSQKSDFALHAGGLALVAHETDATFGDIFISGLP